MSQSAPQSPRLVRRAFPLIILFFSLRALAQPTSAPTTVPNEPPIGKEEMQKIDRHELGSAYNPDFADRYYTAHELLEQYFAATSAQQRTTYVGALESTGLDANTLGRLARVRMNWPTLAEGVYYINDRIGAHNAFYFLGIPKGYDRDKPWPLVIKLPEADAFNTKPPPDGNRVAEIYGNWIRQELADHPDAIIVMPLLNFDELWGPSYSGMSNVTTPLHHAMGRVNIDPARIYMVGHSMSGHAVWNISLLYTTYFSSFNVLCGSAHDDWQRLRLMNLSNTLPVVWHDADDLVVKVDEDRDIARVLKNLKCNVEYEETKGVGHVPTPEIVNRAYDKMRAFVRDLYPKELALQSNRPDTMFNRIDWLQVYQYMEPGKDKKMRFNHGSGFITVTQNVATVKAAITKPNRFELEAHNVQTLRLYFNDQMIDFTRPIKVIVNTRTRYEGMVKPSVDEMLKDQLFLGRGFRYYGAILDIDLTESAGASTGPTSKPTTKHGVIEIIPPEGSNEKPIRIETGH